MTGPDWSIQDIARLAGTTSRTLRHYDDVGLVKPSRIGDNGYRYYDADALVRLQRVLLLRELGLGIPAIGEVLAGQRDDTVALRTHLEWLAQEKERIGRQIASVERTITELEGGEKPMAEKMFDGFDHTQYKDEVEQRWGKDSYAKSDAWWNSLSQDGKDDFMLAAAELIEAWKSAAASAASHPTATRPRPRAASVRLAERHPRNPADAGEARVEGLLHRPRPRCTSPTTASRRTTAGPRARRSCATR